MLQKIITEEALLKFAGSRNFRRGQEYFNAGRVTELTTSETLISAKVEGSKIYEVRLSIKNEKIEFECSCPLSEDGIVCKHCVALGLAWRDKSNPIKRKQIPNSEIPSDDIRGNLLSQDKEELVGMLMERADRDETLHRQLILKTARRKRSGSALSAYKENITDVFAIRDFIPYREMFQFSRQIEDVVTELDDFLASGPPDQVIELCEYALEEWEKAIEQVDDSNGYMTPIRNHIQEIHLKACIKAKPDPKKLAKKLFQWEMKSNWEVFLGAAQTHSEALGEKGLAVYNHLAEKEWTKLPPLVSGSGERWNSERFRITFIMEALAKARGDVEALVEVKKRDLSSSYAYLEIAKIYRNAEKTELALEWAEKGLQEFQTRPDSRLRNFLAEEYQKAGRHSDAIKMIWQNFVERPSLEIYQSLQKYADRSGVWKEWRNKALDLIRNDIASKKEKTSTGRDGIDHSLLVEIFLFEQDIEAAWREAKNGGCSDYGWQRLAEAREKDHPEDALEICHRRLKKILTVSHKDSYREAIEVLRRIRKLLQQMNKESEFERCLTDVKSTNRARPSFMKMLERVRW